MAVRGAGIVTPGAGRVVGVSGAVTGLELADGRAALALGLAAARGRGADATAAVIVVVHAPLDCYQGEDQNMVRQNEQDSSSSFYSAIHCICFYPRNAFYF